MRNRATAQRAQAAWLLPSPGGCRERTPHALPFGVLTHVVARVPRAVPRRRRGARHGVVLRGCAIGQSATRDASSARQDLCPESTPIQRWRLDHLVSGELRHAAPRGHSFLHCRVGPAAYPPRCTHPNPVALRARNSPNPCAQRPPLPGPPGPPSPGAGRGGRARGVITPHASGGRYRPRTPSAPPSLSLPLSSPPPCSERALHTKRALPVNRRRKSFPWTSLASASTPRQPAKRGGADTAGGVACREMHGYGRQWAIGCWELACLLAPAAPAGLFTSSCTLRSETPPQLPV